MRLGFFLNLARDFSVSSAKLAIVDCDCRYPVILREFSLRLCSGGGGGTGGTVGGDGIIRRVQFRRDGMTMSLLSERRSRAPPGLCGGCAAAAGMNLLRRSDGIDINVGAKARLPVNCGDVISINTPGELPCAGMERDCALNLCCYFVMQKYFVVWRLVEC